MKKNFSFVSFLCFLSLILLFGSCQHSVDPPPIGYGRIAVVPDTFSARTAFPHADFDSYKFIFKKVPDTVSELTPDNGGYFTLEVGNYTVEMRAFIGGTLAASGVSGTFSVHEGDNDPVVVYLSPISGAAQGTFTYTVTYPAGAQAVITLQQWDNSLDIPLTPTALSAGNGVTETLNLDAASYLLAVLVSKNGSYAGTTEAVHVYQLLTTEYTHHFNIEDFITPPTPPTEPEPPITSQIKIIHFWVDQHDSLVTTDGTASVTAGETLAITAQGEGYTVRQWFLNGNPTGQNDNAYYFNSTAIGKHTVGLFVEKGGKLFNTNIFITVEAAGATATRSVTIDMFDSNDNGWDGNAAIRVNVNGSEIATVKVNTTGANNDPAGQRSKNTYSFSVSSGDLVELIWVSGSSQTENSLIVYYTDTPPTPLFNGVTDMSWNGTNALIIKLRGSINTSTISGALLGSFTVE